MITPNNTKTTIYKSISEGINEFSKVSQINGYYFDLDNRLLIDGNVYTKTEDVLKKSSDFEYKFFLYFSSHFKKQPVWIYHL
ncbi:hypothetical protein [Lentilactobacillus rapi]|uniref:hypothetical protein n=1 Tax=Lentilactobacillus rapi TaxID=481723 RepID=UPI0006D0F20A|nr:hypothetical protein [Lentilactobacillus rapi]